MWSPTASQDELCHHGILGQRWGKRNGPPYPLDSSDYSQAERKYRTDKGYKKGNKPKGKKPVHKMSDQELERRVRRKQLEQKYNELNEQEVSRGKQKAFGILRDYGTVAAAVITTAKLAETALKIKHGKFGY